MTIIVQEIVVIIMILSLLICRYVEEKKVKYFFIVCIGLNLVYRFEFIPIELSRSFSILCKILELFFVIVIFKFSKKSNLIMILNIILLFAFSLYLIPEKIILNNGGLSCIYRIYGTGGSNVAKGVENLEIWNMLLLGSSYILIDIILILRNRKNKGGEDRTCR